MPKRPNPKCGEGSRPWQVAGQTTSTAAFSSRPAWSTRTRTRTTTRPSVDVNGRTVAYLTRASGRIYRRWLAGQGYTGRPATCPALIVGGWDRGLRGRGHFEVKLDLPSLY